MKKLYIVILLLLCLIPLNTNAKTISDLQKELQDLKAEQKAANDKSANVQAQIDANNAKMSQITNEINNATKEQETLEKDIKTLEDKIDVKNDQIKQLLSFYQLSDSENFYLKYLFGADNFTDFIYRFSVIEQLSAKGDELIDQMNVLIKENNDKIKKLDTKKVELNKLNEEAKAVVVKLGTQKSKYIKEAESYDDQINELTKKIAYYKTKCGVNEDLTVCMGQVPIEFSGFSKPLKSGCVTDEFGMRYHPTLHYWKLHTGIDLGGNGEGTPIYAPAAGKVVRKTIRSSCGGNMLYINHIVNGKYYTTQYMHMLKFNVDVGDTVERGQIIGYVGGGRSTSSYDSCSTGAHLHFVVAKGHYYGTGSNSYSSYSKYVDNMINPRQVLTFPNYGYCW